LLFLDPYPGPDELTQLYSESYFTGQESGALGLPGSDTDYTDFARQRLSKFSATVELLRRFAPVPGRLLDIGAATGDFLSIARAVGYDVAGIELSSFAAEEARRRFGIDLFVGPLDRFTAVQPFNAIHLSHVLEHLPDPHRAVRQLRDLLAPGGIVYVEVPFQWNWAERLHYLVGRRQPFSVFSVHHRLFFRPATLRTLFERYGLTCRHMTLTPPHRYPVETWGARLKWVAWRGLALMGQGLFIEAVFTPSRRNRTDRG
jgi:SAM-dependent methyltransferase